MGRMVRLSALRNCPVICGEKTVGLLHGISLDEAQREVLALVVSCGFRGKRVVLARDIRAVTGSFILAERERPYRRALDRPLCTFVRDTSGMLAGRVTDYAIDERQMRVLAVEMAQGYPPLCPKDRLWMYAFAPAWDRTLAIPASLCREPILCREGIEECAYRP